MLYPHNYTREACRNDSTKISSSIAALNPDITKPRNQREAKRKKPKMHRCMQPRQITFYSFIAKALQLGLLGLSGQVGEENVAEFCGGFVEVVAHAMGAESLANDVKVETKDGSISMKVDREIRA